MNTKKSLYVVHSVGSDLVEVYLARPVGFGVEFKDFKPTKSSLKRIESLLNLGNFRVTYQVYKRDLTVVIYHPEKATNPRAYSVCLHNIGHQGFCVHDYKPTLSEAIDTLIEYLTHEPHLYPEGLIRDEGTGEVVFKHAMVIDPDAGAPCCGEPVYVVGPGAYRCSNCGELLLARDLIETGGVVDSDPPTQAQLYEQTHDMTAEFVELHRHPRDCNCPACDGEPVEDVSEERYLRSRGELY